MIIREGGLPLAKPEFVNLLRNPGIDSQPGGAERQTYLTYRHASLHRLADLIPWNRFLGSINVANSGSEKCKWRVWAKGGREKRGEGGSSCCKGKFVVSNKKKLIVVFE